MSCHRSRVEANPPARGPRTSFETGGDWRDMGRRAEQLCDELKMLAERLGVKVREENLLREAGYHTRSGMCRVKGEDVLFVDRTLPPGDRVEVLVEELSRRDLQGIYVSPALRRLLESRGAGEQAQEAVETAETAVTTVTTVDEVSASAEIVAGSRAGEGTV